MNTFRDMPNVDQEHTTHFACQEVLDRDGGKAVGCCCTWHECKKDEPQEMTPEEQAAHEVTGRYAPAMESLAGEEGVLSMSMGEEGMGGEWWWKYLDAGDEEIEAIDIKTVPKMLAECEDRLKEKIRGEVDVLAQTNEIEEHGKITGNSPIRDVLRLDSLK